MCQLVGMRLSLDVHGKGTGKEVKFNLEQAMKA